MTYVQYFHLGTTGKLIPVCGDRGTVILDGRDNLKKLHDDARRFNGFRRPIYPAYQIFKGNTLDGTFPVTDIVTF